MSEFETGKSFKTVLPEMSADVKPATTRKVICCSGQVYYDLVAERAKLQKNDIAILRLE